VAGLEKIESASAPPIADGIAHPNAGVPGCRFTTERRPNAGVLTIYFPGVGSPPNRQTVE
jgi:hypothetical protein